MDEAVTAVLAKTAVNLREAARDHKLREGQHRKRARELMQQLDLLRVFCADRGIELIESTDRGGHSE